MQGASKKSVVCIRTTHYIYHLHDDDYYIIIIIIIPHIGI